MAFMFLSVKAALAVARARRTIVGQSILRVVKERPMYHATQFLQVYSAFISARELARPN